MLFSAGCDSDERKNVSLASVDGIRFLVDDKPRIYPPDELRVVDTVLRVGEFIFEGQCVQLVHGSKIYTPILEDKRIIEPITAQRGVDPGSKWEVFGGPWDGRLRTAVNHCPPPYFYLTGAAPYARDPPLLPPPLPSAPPRRLDPIKK